MPFLIGLRNEEQLRLSGHLLRADERETAAWGTGILQIKCSSLTLDLNKEDYFF